MGREQTYRQIQSFPDRIQNINLNDVVRQVMERIYAEQGRRGPGERFDSLNIKADERRSPLRFRGQGNRGAGALAFSGVDNASMFIAKGAYMNDNGSWVAEDNTAVIMEYNRDSATPRMFRNTNLKVGQLFQPKAVGWIAIGDPEGVPDIEAVAADTVVPETFYSQVPSAGTGTKYSREDHTHGTQALPAGTGLTNEAGIVIAAAFASAGVPARQRATVVFTNSYTNPVVTIGMAPVNRRFTVESLTGAGMTLRSSTNAPHVGAVFYDVHEQGAST